MKPIAQTSTAILLAAAGAMVSTGASANSFLLFPLSPLVALFTPPQASAVTGPKNGAANATADEVPSRFQRRVVDYDTKAAPGSIVVDTPNTYLYYVLADGRAVRYGIGVGREGFTWSGTQSISRKAEWPDWTPPPQMLRRQPYLPRFVAGGPHNPLGARALYLGGTIYRIHGTNQPETIGTQVSSGCIRMTNEDVIDLYRRVKVGTKVIVLPMRSYADRARGRRG
ncbi:MAG: L,D-transpeptidase [Xanthobacteraceae bacterium]